MSEETTAFHASLHIDGKKIGWAKNDGQGGPTNYGPDDYKDWDIIRKADDYCKQMPPQKIRMQQDDPTSEFEVKMDLENYIDNLVGKFVDERNLKRFEKKKLKEMENSILWGDDSGYRAVKWDKITIKALLAIPEGRQKIKQVIGSMKKKYPEGKLLNTNIPAEFIN